MWSTSVAPPGGGSTLKDLRHMVPPLQELRTQVFGAADLLTFSLTEWLGQPFSFHEAGTALAYGLKAHNSSTKGLVMCVQAYILKHLLFTSHKSGAVGDVLRLLRTSRRAQMDSLVAALSDILWKAGERQHAVLCLTQEENYVNDNPSYIYDGCTEKVRLMPAGGHDQRIVIFEFARYDELKFTIKKHLYELVSENGNGLLLFLYSLILSRTFPRVTEDLGGETVTFLFTNGAIHPSLATLMLTGRATLFLHNGIIYEGSEDTMAKPKTGIVTRAELGLLAWKREEGCDQIKIGSRMKTPTLPIWISRCNDSYGLLFNPNKDLLRDYHAENRFDLYYYSCNSSQTAATVLTIDTRAHASKDEHQSPSLENLIHTKWQDAEVSWNGTAPYV
ncbi:inactive ubiquitin carboxyl-terminal hydrolase MINDY-4B-like [Homarus americanus]|uniref:inactive ubiquitin carboxyl-terminal hydrolase MINDY-4B-like n=1 Tax=Homarus americanus TaxID=6706 RepID=UPI001C46BC8D|nr:inactive ubiquitin carboxyl-terminal hydrolase MINDY-4B-like [Homarus americanus]